MTSAGTILGSISYGFPRFYKTGPLILGVSSQISTGVKHTYVAGIYVCNTYLTALASPAVRPDS